MTFRVRWAPAAVQDVLRLHDFLLDRATVASDLLFADRAIDTVERTANVLLAHAPYSYRRIGARSTRRELVVSWASSGYVVLFEIDTSASILILAVRHQLEDDYH